MKIKVVHYLLKHRWIKTLWILSHWTSIDFDDIFCSHILSVFRKLLQEKNLCPIPPLIKINLYLPDFNWKPIANPNLEHPTRIFTFSHTVLCKNALKAECFACMTLLFGFLLHCRCKIWQVINDGLVVKVMQNKGGSWMIRNGRNVFENVSWRVVNGDLLWLNQRWRKYPTLHSWGQRLPIVALVDDSSQMCTIWYFKHSATSN
jgi:hypothetical protein